MQILCFIVCQVFKYFIYNSFPICSFYICKNSNVRFHRLSQALKETEIFALHNLANQANYYSQYQPIAPPIASSLHNSLKQVWCNTWPLRISLFSHKIILTFTLSMTWGEKCILQRMQIANMKTKQEIL